MPKSAIVSIAVNYQPAPLEMFHFILDASEMLGGCSHDTWGLYSEPPENAAKLIDWTCESVDEPDWDRTFGQTPTAECRCHTNHPLSDGHHSKGCPALKR